MYHLAATRVTCLHIRVRTFLVLPSVGSVIWHRVPYSVAQFFTKAMVLLGNGTSLKTRGSSMFAKRDIA